MTTHPSDSSSAPEVAASKAAWADGGVDPDEPLHLHVDRLLAVDDRHFWIEGWLWDRPAGAVRLTAVSPEGASAELLEGAFRHPRPDLASEYGLDDRSAGSLKLGFASFFELSSPSLLRTGWVVEAEDRAGRQVEAPVPEVPSEALAARDQVLDAVRLEPQLGEGLAGRHVQPALSKVQQRLRQRVGVTALTQYGSAPEAPPATVVVPLYGRSDLLEYQLAQFVHDPEMKHADLVYVADPAIASEVGAQAAELFLIYKLPFRLLRLSHTAGFANANNIAVGVARADLLVLMNSDVLPSRPGWLGRMIDFYGRTPNIGALGPKLLFEDDSLQHAGMYFHDPSRQHEGAFEAVDARWVVWENLHYYKGLHRWLPSANVTRTVPAVTAACMMVAKELYESVGGLSYLYVEGGYEDSDFCLRLVNEGRDNWYLPAVELYHLEAQSYTFGTRALATKYNSWLHTRLWRSSIEELMARPEFSPHRNP